MLGQPRPPVHQEGHPPHPPAGLELAGPRQPPNGEDLAGQPRPPRGGPPRPPSGGGGGGGGAPELNLQFMPNF